MSHRLYQRIENIVRQISPQLDIFDKATTLLSNSEKCSAITKSNNIPLPQYQPITCNPNLRLYKYTKGQWFGRHVDESNRIDFPSASSSKCNNTSTNVPAFANATSVKEAQTEITVLFYLSSCRGGATTFHLPHQRKCSSTSIAFTPEEGAVLLHVHGDRCLEHEAEPVLEGVKYGETINSWILWTWCCPSEQSHTWTCRSCSTRLWTMIPIFATRWMRKFFVQILFMELCKRKRIHKVWLLRNAAFGSD